MQTRKFAVRPQVANPVDYACVVPPVAIGLTWADNVAGHLKVRLRS